VASHTDDDNDAPQYVLEVASLRQNAGLLTLPYSEIISLADTLEARCCTTLDFPEFAQFVLEHRMRHRHSGVDYPPSLLRVTEGMASLKGLNHRPESGSSDEGEGGPEAMAKAMTKRIVSSHSEIVHSPSAPEPQVEASDLMERFLRMTSSPSFARLTSDALFDSAAVLNMTFNQVHTVMSSSLSPALDMPLVPLVDPSFEIEEVKPVKPNKVRNTQIQRPKPPRVTKATLVSVPPPIFNYANPIPPSIPHPQRLSKGDPDTTFLGPADDPVTEGGPSPPRSPRHRSMYQMVRLFQRTPFMSCVARPPPPTLVPQQRSRPLRLGVFSEPMVSCPAVATMVHTLPPLEPRFALKDVPTTKFPEPKSFSANHVDALHRYRAEMMHLQTQPCAGGSRIASRRCSRDEDRYDSSAIFDNPHQISHSTH
jgi:hypothetical protein